MSDRNLRKMYDVSTGHLRKQDIEALSAYTGDGKKDKLRPLLVYPNDYGWYVSVGFITTGHQDSDEENKQELLELGFSPEFVAMLSLAAENDVAMIQYDSDAEPMPGMKFFEYGTDIEIENPADAEISPSI